MSDEVDVLYINIEPKGIDGQAVSTVEQLKIDAKTNGANGLDEGLLLPSKDYAVYIISHFPPLDLGPYECPDHGSECSDMKIAAVLSLSETGPLLPSGYNSYRKVGSWPTDENSHLKKEEKINEPN